MTRDSHALYASMLFISSACAPIHPQVSDSQGGGYRLAAAARIKNACRRWNWQGRVANEPVHAGELFINFFLGSAENRLCTKGCLGLKHV